MIHQPSILALQPRGPVEIAPGVTVLARVTVQLGPVLLAGCSLTYSRERGHRLLMPGRNRSERAVIICPVTMEAALQAALAVYESEITPPAAMPVAKAPETTETLAT